MTQRSRSRGRPRILTILALSVFSPLFLAFGTLQLWDQQFGVPVRMTVVSCGPQTHIYGRATPSRAFVHWLHKVPVYCYGRASDAPDQKPIKIYGVQYGDVGHIIDVHLSSIGKSATKDSWWWPLIGIGLGCVFGLSAVRAIVRPLRRAPPNTDRQHQAAWEGAGPCLTTKS